jgi:putative SOS response-associated peptidase YedK
MRSKAGQQLKPEPFNNARTEKLDSGLWRSSFEKRRCVIRVEAFAEGEGPKGVKIHRWRAKSDTVVFWSAARHRPSLRVHARHTAERRRRFHQRRSAYA